MGSLWVSKVGNPFLQLDFTLCSRISGLAAFSGSYVVVMSIVNEISLTDAMKAAATKYDFQSKDYSLRGRVTYLIHWTIFSQSGMESVRSCGGFLAFLDPWRRLMPLGDVIRR